MWRQKIRDTPTRKSIDEPAATAEILHRTPLENIAAAKEAQLSTDSPSPVDVSEVEPRLAQPPPVSPAIGPWKMSLLLTCSAFCGGIAVVLWNRRLLTRMREVPPVSRQDQQRRLWEDDI